MTSICLLGMYGPRFHSILSLDRVFFDLILAFKQMPLGSLWGMNKINQKKSGKCILIWKKKMEQVVNIPCEISNTYLYFKIHISEHSKEGIGTNLRVSFCWLLSNITRDSPFSGFFFSNMIQASRSVYEWLPLNSTANFNKCRYKMRIIIWLDSY